MGFNPPPYPMTRNSVPPPPPPPPPKRIINEGWPSVMKKKQKDKEMKIETFYDHRGEKIIRYGNSDGYHFMKMGRHGKLDAVMGEELDAINALLDHAEQEKIQKAKLNEDVEKQRMAHSFYASGVPLVLNDEWLAKITIDDNKMKPHEYEKFINNIIEGKEDSAKDELKRIVLQKVDNIVKTKIEEKAKPRFPPNILVNESTGEVTYDHVSEEQKRQWPQPQFKKDADPSKKKQKEIVKPEPKPEYGETINIRRKKSRWERIIDRIIKNIVWGK